MFVSIFGLPANIKYQDLKSLIKQQCNLIDMIVDHIVSAPDGTKKVRVGLADDAEAMRLVKGLDGYRLQGNHVIKVVPIGKTASSQQGFETQQYPPVNEFGNQSSDYRGSHRPPMDALNRPQPWSSGVQSAWSQDPTMTQVPQNSFGYQQQGYGQQAPFQSQRPDAPYSQRQIEARSHVLRNVEIVDSPTVNHPPVQQGRYPPGQGYQQHEKPGTIKDTIHGPPRWDGPANQQGPTHYQGQSHGESQPWSHQNPGQYDKPYDDDRRVPLGKRDPKLPTQMRNQDFKNFDKPSSGRPEPGGRMIQGRPVSPRQTGRPLSPSKPGIHGRQSPGRQGRSPGRQPGRPLSPRHSGRLLSPERPVRMIRPGSPRQTGRIDSGISGRHSPGRIPSGRAGSPKNYSDLGRPIDGRPGMAGRNQSPGRQLGRQISPSRQMSGRPGSPSNRHPGGRLLPSGKDSPPGRHPMRPGSPAMRPSGRPGSPGKLGPFSGRPVSPGARVISDQRPGMARPGSPGMRPGRHISPESRALLDQRSRMGRPGSPGRFGSGKPGSPDRRLSPHHKPGHGRPASPPGRRVSPHGRMPSGRPGSPMRRGSPSLRRPVERGGDSPRRMSPRRYSPDRHHPDKHDPYDHDSKSKLVRPAYESSASSKGMYSSGFRPNVSWQKDDKYPKIDDDRREGRIPPRVLEAEKRVHSTERKSRSPVRRDRSPLRDRFKRHSPSPRSPRRSWALEKRRSPEMREAPPPPVWPGQKHNDNQFPRRNIPDRMEKEEKSKHVPIWEGPADHKVIDRRREDRRLEDERMFEEKGDRRDILNRELRNERFAPQNERPDKFSPREIDNRRDFRPNEDRRDFHRRSADREDRHRGEELSHQRNTSPQRIDELNIRRNFDKELEDIYKRAVEFRKRAESLRRSGERRGEGYREEKRDTKEDSAFERSRLPPSPGHRDYRRSPSQERRPGSRERAEWKIEQKPNLPDHVKAKREKALKEIVNRLLERQTVCDYIEGEFEMRLREELKLEISKIIQTIFGNEDVSFIEIIIKYQAKFNIKDEEQMLRAVLNSLPKPNKNLKRSGPETSEVAAKTARRSSPTAVKGEASRPKLSDSTTVNWAANIEPPKLASVSTLSNALSNNQMGILNSLGASQFGVVQPMMLLGDNQQAMVMNHNLMASHMAMHMSDQMTANQPAMVPAPYDAVAENKFDSKDPKGLLTLYLSHEDFQPFNSRQAKELHQFLFSKIVEFTESSRGWAPDIIIKGLQSLFHYELQTKDSRSRDWVLNLDFSGFNPFNVVVYTKEELWYERAAIWLPGHSRSRNIEPLDKLKLQNKKLNNIKIGKWKLVKKIVNDKGTRLFVDMPPASARALDKYKMMLSYELQKVNVFLRSAAVDKDAFDVCMREFSITDKSVPYKAAQNAPFPVINNDPSLVKITLSGSETMSIEDARKIKEVVIYNIFRYHQMNGSSRTNFVKHGFCKPNYFGIVPEDMESKKWLLSRNFGKLKNSDIVVVGGDEDETKLFPMKILVDSGYSLNASKILERLKSSNQGVKGINFNRWKIDHLVRVIDNRTVGMEVQIDVDSLETLRNMKYQLDYVTDRNVTETVKFKSVIPYHKLEEELKIYKNEMADSYDVANMDLDSDDDNVTNDENVICLD